MKQCKHLNTNLQGTYQLYYVYCKDCKQYVGIADALSSVYREVQKIYKKMKKEMK